TVDESRGRGDRAADDDHARDRPEEDPTRPAAVPGERVGHERLLVVLGDARVELVDVERPVQAEELRIPAQEALRVGLAGQELPALLLERRQVALADPELAVHVRGREAPFLAGFAKRGADLEHPPAAPRT